MQILAQNLAVVPIGTIRPYEGNSRKHSNRQIDKIAASIAEFGFNAPILIDDGGVIVAGHGRYAAALRLGLAEVPVVQLGHLTEAKRRAYVIADNRIAEDATWDMTKLATEVQSLQAEGIELGITGLDDVDFTRIDMELRKMAADLAMIDAPPPAPPAPAPAPVAAPAASQVQVTVNNPAPASAPAPVAAPPMAPISPINGSTPLVPFNVLLTPEQRDIVLQRLNAAKESHQLKTLGEAIFHICAAYRAE